MSRSTRCLAPHLQELWTQVYAIAWGHNAYQDTEGNPKNAHDKAEDAAWEAVRRANGGVAPGPLDAVEELAPIIVSVAWPSVVDSDEHIALAKAILRAPSIGAPEVRRTAECALAVWKALRGEAT